MRKRVETFSEEVKTGTLENAGARYGFGRKKMRVIAEDAGAIVKLGRSIRVNFTILDNYMDSLSGK